MKTTKSKGVVSEVNVDLGGPSNIEPVGTEQDDSYLKEFMDVLDNNEPGQEENDAKNAIDVRLSQPQARSQTYDRESLNKNEETNMFSSMHKKKKPEPAVEPYQFKEIYRLDERKNKEIENQVNEAINRRMRIINMFRPGEVL